jgi:hypothetical protein
MPSFVNIACAKIRRKVRGFIKLLIHDRLRELAHDIDVQEPVLRPGALDHNVVGKLEATLEGPLGEV